MGEMMPVRVEWIEEKPGVCYNVLSALKKAVCIKFGSACNGSYLKKRYKKTHIKLRSFVKII
jgi:hypothetical protein